MKHMERIALALRTRDGIPGSELRGFTQETNDLIAMNLLQESRGRYVLTRKGKALADSITEIFL
jgi:coproporphyrinogen III oxidase-like Fe-S oxidoreductase